MRRLTMLPGRKSSDCSDWPCQLSVVDSRLGVCRSTCTEPAHVRSVAAANMQLRS